MFIYKCLNINLQHSCPCYYNASYMAKRMWQAVDSDDLRAKQMNEMCHRETLCGINGIRHSHCTYVFELKNGKRA